MSSMVDRISRYREILKREPHSRVYVPLADLLRQHGETEEALVLLEDGLVRDPEHQSALVVLGCTLLQAGRHEHGVKVLDKVLETGPDNFVVLRVLAEHFLATDDFVRAVPLLERLVGFEPDHAEWGKLLSDARERLVQGEEKSLEEPSQSQAKSSDQSLATMTLVDIMVSQGYLDKALAALERMKEAEPDRTDIQERLAQLQSGAFTPGALKSAEEELSADEISRRRAGQKEQFGDWIENFKSDHDSSS